MLLELARTLLPQRLLNEIASIEVLLPYYHVVSNEYLPHIGNIYNYKNLKQFSADLDWLLKYRRPIHPDDLAKYVLEKRKLPYKAFLLTFDDGYKEVYEVVAPLLLKKGIPAIFFVVPSFLDNKELFYRCKISLILEELKKNPKTCKHIAEYLSLKTTDVEVIKSELLSINYLDRRKADVLGRFLNISFEGFLNHQKPFLTTLQLKELSNMGFSIGAHSFDHPNYSLIPETEQIDQTISSLAYVKEITHAKTDFFSFPFEEKSLKQSFFDKLISIDNSSQKLLFGVQDQLDESRNIMLHRFYAESPFLPISRIAREVMLETFILKLLKQNSVKRMAGLSNCLYLFSS